MSYIPNLNRQLYILMLICITVGAGLTALGHRLFLQAPAPAPQSLASLPRATPRHYIAAYAITWRKPAGYPTAPQDPTTIHRIGLRAWSTPSQVQLLNAIRYREGRNPDIVSILAFPAVEVSLAAWSLDWLDLTLPQSPLETR